ncbi:MAG: glycosyltransferase [Verrucomicrobiota bacterium]|jgi:glycosyltransferase involved in cell wall biosynthesis
MTGSTYPRIICLSNVFDQHYHDVRGEKVDRGLGAKRRVLFQCLERASGRELIVLSVPPKAVERRTGKWLPPTETKFDNHRQLFCCNWDVPKWRIPLSWFFYARQALRHVRSGDLVLIDNYEFVYIVAARLLQIFRRVTFVLDYEDGKHLIDRSWARGLSWLAETCGRGLVRGALLANPELGKRLPASAPTEVVPGFVPEELPPWTPTAGGEVRFLYTGGLDPTRGVDLLLEALEQLPERGWHLDITGYGPLTEPVARFAQETRWRGRVAYRHALPTEAYDRLLSQCHVGLNCQRISDPISGVTFPSKVFTYLTAGLMIISTKASGVETVCGNACLYYEEETPQSLAAVMKEVIEHFSAIRQKLDRSPICSRYSPEATTVRLQHWLKAIGWQP